MGVTKLWEVLKDVKTDVTLDTIKGQTLAVDLATWICESEGVKPMQSHVVRPYLRNLFFRVSAVLKAGINLVFVLDGKAPELKLETIARRLGSSGGNPRKTSGVRSRLNAKLKECCVLLDSLGVPWIKAESEAEALCARLNKLSLVDAVVTSDGDTFLYGARTVYRNFSVEKHVSIEKYDICDIENVLSLHQRDLIALGLLLGCDYCPKGVPGIGVAQAIKLLSSFGDRDALRIFSKWRETGETFNNCEFAKKRTHCSTCGHEGTKKDHCDVGCNACGQSCAQSTSASKKKLQSIPCQCRWHQEDEERKLFTLEEKIKTSALQDPKFPDQNIVLEFLKTQNFVRPGKVGVIDPKDDPSLVGHFKTKAPILDIACEYLKQKLEWESSYALSKVLPLATHYLLTSSNEVGQSQSRSGQICVHSILKTRVKDRIRSLEVKWTIGDGVLASAMTGDDIVTIESEDDMRRVFSGRVEEFYCKLEREKDKKKTDKADARKAERKKLKGSPVKTGGSIQTKKLTDYFKAKKLRNEERSVGVEIAPKVTPEIEHASDGETDLRSLETQLQSLSLIKDSTGVPTRAIDPTVPKRADDKALILSQECSTVNSRGRRYNKPTTVSDPTQPKRADDNGPILNQNRSTVNSRGGQYNKPTSVRADDNAPILSQKCSTVNSRGGQYAQLASVSDPTMPKRAHDNGPTLNQKRSTVNSRDGQYNKKPSHPVIVFSSDSDDSDTGADSIMRPENPVNRPSTGYDAKSRSQNQTCKVSDVSDNEGQNNTFGDITFENELDFSLGCSLLNTPISNPPERKMFLKSNLRDRDGKISPLKEVNLNTETGVDSWRLREKLKTPDKPRSLIKTPVVSDSPVFLTLMERLKAKREK